MIWTTARSYSRAAIMMRSSHRTRSLLLHVHAIMPRALLHLLALWCFLPRCWIDFDRLLQPQQMAAAAGGGG